MNDFVDIMKQMEIARNSGLSNDLSFIHGYCLGLQGNSKIEIIGHLQLINSLKYSQTIDDVMLSFLVYQVITNSKELPKSLQILFETQNEEALFVQLDSTQQGLYQSIYNHLNQIPPEVEFKNPSNPIEQPYEETKEPYDPMADPYSAIRNPYNEILSPYNESLSPYNESLSHYNNSYIPENVINNETEAYKAEIKCIICLEDFSISDYMPITTCSDIFDRQCLNRYLTGAINDRNFPLKCPGCKVELSQEDISNSVDIETYNKYNRFMLQNFVDTHSDDFSCCPTPNCSYVFVAGGESYFQCALCFKEYCLKCKVEYHIDITCAQYVNQLIEKKTVAADKQFLEFVRGTKYKQCPNCKFWVEKSSGCNHMTCRCKYEFCYVCGGKYGACRC